MASAAVSKSPDQVRSSKYAKNDKDGKESNKNNDGSRVTRDLDRSFDMSETMKLDSSGIILYDGIADQYISEKDPNISAIENFLRKGGGGKMDACLRWRVLVAALNNSDTTHDRAVDAISEIIISIDPVLAFAPLNPRDDSRPALRAFCFDDCKNKSKHKTDITTVPFNLAAKMGKHKLVGLMISSISGILDRAKDDPKHPLHGTTMLELVQFKDQDSRQSPLALAQMARKTPLETLKELLQVPGIADGDRAFERALENGWDRIVEAFLEHEVEVSTANGDPILQALRKLTEPVKLEGAGESVRSSKGDCRLNVLQCLVRKSPRSQNLSKEVVEALIKQDLTHVWKIWREKSESENDSVLPMYPWLLHMAVLEGKLDFVRIFVEDYPEALSKEEIIPGQIDHEGSTDKFPLWYNNQQWFKAENEETGRLIPKRSIHKSSDHQNRRAIRDIIVTQMIHELDMDKLPDILHRSHESFDDLCFDISRFNSAAYRISDIVDSLILQDADNERQMHQYESTLKYVAFPPFDTMIPDREVYRENLNLKRGHDEVFRVLDWLQKKGVKKIIKLTIPDRLVNPHDDLKMAEYVKRFEVEVLDWKVLDMCISIFQGDRLMKQETKQAEINELYLYSSGRRAAINHWFNKDDGVESLRKVSAGSSRTSRRFITLHHGGLDALEYETCTAVQVKELLDYIHLQIQNLADRTEGSQRKIRSVDPIEVPWYPSASVADLSKIAQRVSPPLAEWLTKLAGFVQNRNNASKEVVGHRPTRVAILDNGVLSISPISQQADSRASTRKSQERSAPEVTSGDVLGGEPTEERPPARKRGETVENSLWSRIKAGRSFVDGNLNFSPWQFPSDPHGTQMANLICAIDPFCELYVARVAEDAFGINAKNVIKAIQWAIDEDVDIISMSFVLGEDPGDLMQAKINEAGRKGIVITCSTHDEGARITKAYPASNKAECSALLVLAACDEYGKLLREIDTNSYSYKLRGQDVPAGVIPFIKSKEKISGSSVATALGAGLCSLILTCARLADPSRTFDENVDITKSIRSLPESSRVRVIEAHLALMVSGISPRQDDNYVLLERFGGIAQPSPGDGVKHDSGDRTGSTGPPSPETVLRKYFGMK